MLKSIFWIFWYKIFNIYNTRRINIKNIVCEVCGADGEGKIKLETILKKNIKKNTSTTYKNNQTTGEAEILYFFFSNEIKILSTCVV